MYSIYLKSYAGEIYKKGSCCWNETMYTYSCTYATIYRWNLWERMLLEIDQSQRGRRHLSRSRPWRSKSWKRKLSRCVRACMYSTLQFPSYGILTYICIRIHACKHVRLRPWKSKSWKRKMSRYVRACMYLFIYVSTWSYNHERANCENRDMCACLHVFMYVSTWGYDCERANRGREGCRGMCAHVCIFLCMYALCWTLSHW